MKANRRLALGTLAALAAVTASTGASAAETQIILAQVSTSIAISSAPTASVDIGALPATAASIGSITVAANTPYILTAQAAKATMTSWDGTSYGTGTLATPMKLTSTVATPITASTNTGVGIVATDVTDTVPLTIATGALGLLVATTDTYNLAATQLTAVTDAAGTYRNVITYTATAPL